MPHVANGELGSSEHKLLFAHIEECQACFDELTKINATQLRLKDGLAALANSVEPSPAAWQSVRASVGMPAPRPLRSRPVFVLRAVGVAFAMVSLASALSFSHPAWDMGLGAGDSVAGGANQPIQIAQARVDGAASIDARRVSKMLESEPNSSARIDLQSLAISSRDAVDDTFCQSAICGHMQ
jgi:hypothetical protein